MKICKLIRFNSFKDVRVFEKQAVSSAKMGHHVTIVAGKQQGFVFGINRKPIKDKAFQPGHFIYKGVHFLTYDAKFMTGSNRALMIKNMIQDLKSDNQKYFVDKLFEKALSTEADIYHAHGWETLYEAVQIKRLLRKKGRNVKIVFDAHELEDNNELLKLMMKEVDHLITVSEAIKSIYITRYPGIPVTVIYNSPFYQEKIPRDKYQKNPFTVTFEGVVTNDKGNPKKIIEIANLCKAKIGNFRFNILGKLPDSSSYQGMKKRVDENPYIDTNWVEYHDLPEYLSDTHVGYIYFNLNHPNRVNAMPNKFFSYLNSGVPVVVNQALEMGNFIKKYRCGIVIEKKEPTAADYVEQFQRLHENRKLLSAMGQNARKVMRSYYCWEKMEERLEGIYKGLK